MSESTKLREAIAEDIIRRADTVSILTCAEVSDIKRRAEAGEFDDYCLVSEPNASGHHI